MDQSEHGTRWPQGQRLGPRIGRKYIRVLTLMTSVGNAACTFDIDTRPENWPTANLRHVSATCAQYGIGPTLVGMLLHRRRAPSQKGRSRRRRGYATLPSTGAGRDPAGLREGGRLGFAPGPPDQRWPKQCPGAALPKWRPSYTAGGRPHKRGAHADGVDTRPCPAEGRAAIQPASPKVADLRYSGAACPEAAQIVSWGRLTQVAALLHRRRAPSQKGRPRRRRGYAALPSTGAGRDPAGLPEGGRLTI